MDRRKFLKQTTLSGGALIANTNEIERKISFMSNDLKLKIFTTNWGFKGTASQFCKKAKEEGYDGVEIWVPSEEKERDDLFNAIEKNNLAYGLFAGNHGKTYENHWNTFQFQVNQAVSLKPMFINCHSGKDYFSMEQSMPFIDLAARLSKESGIPIYHETHRGRILFAANIAKSYLEKIPDLRITLDISHWCCVSESLLADQSAAVDLALSRTDHIHSRVGFEEGPQVSEPRAPEFKKAVAAHFNWWDKVVAYKKQSGEVLTMTTEFGPPNYMWTLPYTRQPVADLWEVNAYMMRLWRERYQGS